METKKRENPPLISKATIEFIIAVSISVLSFTLVNYLGFFERFHQTRGRLHRFIDEFMLGATFFAIGLMIFTLRRWLELRKTHKELAESEEQLRFQANILDEIGDNVTGTDLEGKITYVNKAKCDMMQKEREDFVGQSVRVYGDSEVAGGTQSEIVDTTLKEGKWSGEVINTTSDGNKFTVELHTWLLKDEKGRPTGMCGVSRNITERKERDKELQQHKNYLEALDATAGALLKSTSEIDYEEFLSILGPASGADRAIVFFKQVDKDGNAIIRPKSQWCKRAIEPLKQLGRFTTDLWPKWEPHLVKGNPIYWLLSELPEDERAFWGPTNIKAMLVLPIIINGNLEGFVSFDNRLKQQQWTESEIGFLHTAVNNLANAMRVLGTQEELKKERDFAEGLIETAQTIVLVLDKDANIITFNKYFENLSGYKLNEVKGKNWFETFLPAQDKEKIHHIFDKAIEDIPTKGNINPIITKDGRYRYIEWFDKTLKDITGQTTVLLATGQDITERLEAEQAIKDSEARLKTIFENSLDGILIADIETKKFQMCNQAICQMLGYSEEELKQHKVEDVHPAEDLPMVIKTFESQVRGEFKLAEALPIKRKDGSVFYADVNTSVITLDGRKCIMGSFRDITQRKKAQEELKKAHLELEQRVIQRTSALQETNAQLLKTMEERDRIQKVLQETEKLAGAGKLAAQIAHEINNPLAGIKNSLLLIKEAVPSDHQYFEYVSRVQREIDRVSHTVKQMFNLYQPDATPAQRFRLSETINDIVELLEVTLHEKQIKMEVDCPTNIVVSFSEALLRQIVYNLVQNAIQASGPDTTIKITAWAGDGKVNMSVSDQGSGIEESIRDKIFEPFFTTGKGGPKSGLGLGLAITKDIITAVNGTIDFTSETNKGTVFNISIPVQKNEEEK